MDLHVGLGLVSLTPFRELLRTSAHQALWHEHGHNNATIRVIAPWAGHTQNAPQSQAGKALARMWTQASTELA